MWVNQATGAASAGGANFDELKNPGDTLASPNVISATFCCTLGQIFDPKTTIEIFSVRQVGWGSMDRKTVFRVGTICNSLKVGYCLSPLRLPRDQDTLFLRTAFLFLNPYGRMTYKLPA